MAKEMKRLMAEDLQGHLEGSPEVLVVGLLPMDAEATVELRSRVRKQGAYLRVIHNRTARHALDERRQALGRHFHGQTALAIPRAETAEMIAIAKTLFEAARSNRVELRGGYVEGEHLDAEGVRMLAMSPDKPTLRAMALSAVLGPARGIAGALHAVGGGIARCLQARVDQSGEQATND